MTHLRCQQASCSALTASHRDSAQSACLSVRPSVRPSHSGIVSLPSTLQPVRISVRPSVCPSITLPFHRSSAASRQRPVCPSVHLSVHHTSVLCRYPSIARQHGRILTAAAAHCRQPPRQILSKFPKNSPKTQIRLDGTLNFDETGSIENDGQ